MAVVVTDSSGATATQQVSITTAVGAAPPALAVAYPPDSTLSTTQGEELSLCEVTGQIGNTTEGPFTLTFPAGMLTNGASLGGVTGTVSARGTMTLNVTDSCDVTFPVSGTATTAGAQFELTGTKQRPELRDPE